jgi:hypothetical protein
MSVLRCDPMTPPLAIAAPRLFCGRQGGSSIGLDPLKYAAHSMGRTEV